MGLPFVGDFNSSSLTATFTTFVANQLICSRGKTTPKIIPGKPVKDSGPPETGISSV